MLRDFELLSHFEEFRFKDVQLHVDRNDAAAQYRWEGRPRAETFNPEVVPPRTGVLYFRRGSTGWELEDHHFRGQ